MRKITSLTALLSFVFLMLTSVILYIVPAGRVAYWADYHLWGLTKEEWGNLHINLGVLFLLSILLHTYYNWSAVISYMKNKAKELVFFTFEFNVALVFVVLFSLGTYLDSAPFSYIINLGQSISAEAEKFYGEPPYGHAELSSIKTFSKKMELDLTLSMQRLRNAGFNVESSDQTLKELSGINKTSPKELYLIISPKSERASKTFPSQAPPGIGKRPLIDLCQEYSVSIKTVLWILEEEGISAEETDTIKEIANISGKDPFAIYEIIRQGLDVEVAN